MMIRGLRDDRGWRGPAWMHPPRPAGHSNTVPRPTLPPLPASARPPLAASGHGAMEAVDAWAAHLAAGRIGVAAPPPPAPPGYDYGCASLEAILAGVAPAARGGRS